MDRRKTGSSKTEALKKRIFDIIQIGNTGDFPSRLFDICLTLVIFLSLGATILSTYDEMKSLSPLLDAVELVTVILFTIEYILRLWTSDILYPDRSKPKAFLSFIISPTGIVDFLTFFPYYLPIVFASGAVAFRVFRVIRIFRLFTINARYDAFSVIIDVLKAKSKQIISSVVMIVILMVASSLCMYSLEHEAQPEVFRNAFSGIWWSMSTLLTIGYGDIYPVTAAGRIMAIVIAFLGVGMVAIPTGIISAGFVEVYTKIDRENAKKRHVHFLVSVSGPDHEWCGKKLRDIDLPEGSEAAVIIRKGEVLLPDDGTKLKAGDDVVMISTGKAL